MRLFRIVIALSTFGGAVAMNAKKTDAGSAAGVVVDQGTRHAVEYAAIVLKDARGRAIRRTATDSKGAFSLESVPFGEYRVAYGLVGENAQESPPFHIDAQHPAVDLGVLALATDVLTMQRVVITARKEAFYNSIDRKVYNVGKDIQSAAGSASDLLQNVPSVQVDVEGNVSLRGNDNVLILVNGKPSSLMSTTNRADVLAQMPADSIEKIEVITNPSAKYKPDGTAGIINLTVREKHDSGYSGVIRGNLGNDRRGNFGLTANYNPGKYNVFGTVSVRQDDRLRTGEDIRSHLDSATNTFIATEQKSTEHMRPLSRLARIGVDYNADSDNKIGATADYNFRTFFRTATVSNVARAADGTVTGDYDRRRTDPEWQKTFAYTGTYDHTFAEPGRGLNVELKHERHWEQEDNHYTNSYRTPAGAASSDYTLIMPTETSTQLTVDYTQPFADGAKLEAGYAGEANKNDMDFRGGFYDPASNSWVVDAARTNRFIYRDTIHAFYATYGRPVGHFGFLAGWRMEQTNIDTDQATVHLTGKNDYFRVYPSLHLSYNLTEASQLQLNYSHRVHRPETEDLNPFPEYQDPYNLRAGNPQLRPEDTHSIEGGYQYHKDSTTYLATLYFRDTYHAFTTVSRYIDATTLLTTHENLASNRSGGLELGAKRDLGPRASVNFSGNAYYSEVDASNLGFAARRSAIAWEAKVNASWQVTPTNLVQLDTNYRAKRLTAQGYRLPNFVANVGLRHDFKGRNTALVFTVSDVFDSQKERTVIDTPVLHDDFTGRRSSRIFYLGFIYNFGKPEKKPKNDLEFDSSS